ncbi:apolipoprotein N-acyltransferase [Pseudoduganella sp. CY13W]|uniref:Apolipoprotein N-acyltransferase n=2 Tax=Duganella qianjiadongensis TaxID=2692176 RepID=A0ABW9VMH7_9BURK|nr:apolipoprotein N-acyltransferase [Duganella qianjiadongensis]
MPSLRTVTLASLALLASAVLAGCYARGGAGWPLGFCMLVPWLLALQQCRHWSTVLGYACLMALAYTVAVFAWLGYALGQYTGMGEAGGLACLMLAAPLFQPQFLVFALARHVVMRRAGATAAALVAPAAWVATEWLLPRLLDDTPGYGLYPSPLLRQGAAVGGAAGLTLLLLLANEGWAAVLRARHQRWRAQVAPLLLAVTGPLLLAAYGALAGPAAPAATAKPVRLALVQANITDYEGLRRQQGTAAVVRQVLDTHFVMSRAAVQQHHAQALVWSETIYPTTLGHPKSSAGAALDEEILAAVADLGVPLLLGTYDRDSAGEYNAAALLQPDTGVQGYYRKTRLFPLTEYVPAWLDGALVRRWLPWTGSWQAGNGARVFPLKLGDGREIVFQPLICLDDVDTTLALEGARLGAQLIVSMSNDAWFTAYPEGARLHQTVAAFRSIETGLPQVRVTTNGYSAAFDAGGAMLAASSMGTATLVVADVVPGGMAVTPLVRWGNWVGPAACIVLLALVVMTWLRVAERGLLTATGLAATPVAAPALPLQLGLPPLPPAARLAVVLLRAVAGASVLALGLALWRDPPLRSNTLAQLRFLAAGYLLPQAAAWCVLRAYPGRLCVAVPAHGGGLLGRCYRARLRLRRRIWDRPCCKLVLLPLALALAVPAFILHQNIVFGSALGEYDSLGLAAYLQGLALWWGAWACGVLLCAATLRLAIEVAALLVAAARPDQAASARYWLERGGALLLYLGLPAALLLRVYAA